MDIFPYICNPSGVKVLESVSPALQLNVLPQNAFFTQLPPVDFWMFPVSLCILSSLLPLRASTVIEKQRACLRLKLHSTGGVVQQK